MKKYLKPLVIVGVLLLLWSITDFYNYMSIGMDTLNNYLGTSNEDVIRQLVNAQIQNGIFKAVIGLVLIIVPFVKRNK